MKTKLISGTMLCIVLCLGCSKDSDSDNTCGKIKEIRWYYAGYTSEKSYRLIVKMSDGSTRCGSVKTDSFEVGDEYCNATGTCN